MYPSDVSENIEDDDRKIRKSILEERDIVYNAKKKKKHITISEDKAKLFVLAPIEEERKSF
jgi:hypothetical protein